ncbi:MAG: hypothetical protein HND44_24725 [Chloroflexi bacterium]|nr:hypothetical protein [Ardenticatenaceae bacterium]NOG37739.1 hypothetical protein [Chloroflexota bacterium]
MDTILASATVTGTRLAETLRATHGWNLTASEAFLLVYGGSVSFMKMGVACDSGCWGRSTGRNSIEVYTNIVDDGGVNRLIGDEHWAVHELGHSFVNATGGSLPLTHYENLQRVGYADRGGRCLSEYCGFAGDQWEWQRSGDGATSEEFADMFLGWVYSQWESGTINGYQRSLFMNHMMPTYVDMTVNR